MKIGKRTIHPGVLWGLGGGIVAVLAITIAVIAVLSTGSLHSEFDGLRSEQQLPEPVAASSEIAQPVQPTDPIPSASEAPEPPANAPAPAPQPVVPAPVPAAPSLTCPNGSVSVVLSGVTSKVSTPSNTGDAPLDIMQVNATVVITNGTNFPVIGVGQIQISGVPSTAVDTLNAYLENTTLQPGQSRTTTSFPGSAFRYKLETVQSWKVTAAIGQFYFQNVDPRCPGVHSTNIVVGG